MRDGESFEIGGLTQESVISSQSKVPLLGTAPLAPSTELAPIQP